MSEELLGRADEARTLRTLIRNARNGRGGEVVLCGDPGIGKTALLDATTAELGDLQLIRFDGYEAESSMPFAAVERLLRHLRTHLTALPQRQQHALLVACGQADGPPPDRFLVGLGLLGLLAVAGEQRAVVCAVDDAHLLDPESLDVLAFVGRRLRAESVVVLLAGRDSPEFDARVAGLTRLRLAGLGTEAATALLRRSVPEPFDPPVALHVVTATGGNPLALVDLAGELTALQLTESMVGQEPVPIGAQLEQFYLRQIHRLDQDAQTWLLVAAAESTGDLELVAGACVELGLAPDVGERARAAGLLKVGHRVSFRHPLVCSVAYTAPSATLRRRVHQALAVVAERLERTEHAAWHAAKATPGSSEDVARRLERVADTAAARGGLASRTRALVKAAAVSPPGPPRQTRLVAAAEAALASGSGQLARSLMDEVDEQTLDPVTHGRLIALGADHALFVAAPTLRWACADMLRAAALFHGFDDDLEQHTLIRAWEWALPSSQLTAGVDWEDFGHRLRAAADLKEGPAAIILRAIAALVLDPYPDAVPVLRAALTAFEQMDDAQVLRYGHSSVALATALWEVDQRHHLLERWAAVARDRGALQLLDNALWVLALSEAIGGAPRHALQYMDQVRELRRAIGWDAEHVVNVPVMAWFAAEAGPVEAAARAAYDLGMAGVEFSATLTLAGIDLAHGRCQAVLDRLRPHLKDPWFYYEATPWPDYAEAAIRLGRLQEGREIVARLDEVAQASGAAWIRGVTLRLQALALTTDPAAERLYQKAIEVLEGCRAQVDLGRAHLAYGEWLRRARRRAQARTSLRAAVHLFTRAGAEPFRERAVRELEATGGPRPVAAPERPGGLTQQELTVAELAAAGRTNAEIAAAMFLTANTVDYHLRKVFQKLGISSRRQLSDRLGQF